MPSPYDNKINHAAGAAGEKLNSTCLDSCVDYKPTRFPTHNQSKQSLLRECFNLGSQRTRERVAIISVTKQADCSSRLCSQLLYVETEEINPIGTRGGTARLFLEEYFSLGYNIFKLRDKQTYKHVNCFLGGWLRDKSKLNVVETNTKSVLNN